MKVRLPMKKSSTTMNAVKLLRPKHWLKNVLLFISITFSGRLSDPESVSRVLVGFLAFSFMSSAVYILNDIRDREADRCHEVKRNRPIASGAVNVPTALGLMAILLALGLMLNLMAFGLDWNCLILLFTYFAVNLGYSMGLKNVPFLDIFLLVSGFSLRVFYGAAIIHEEVSNWVLLTVLALSFYLSLGKRRNELMRNREKNTSSVRRVLHYYSFSFLDKFMYLCLAIAIVFYALWSADTDVINTFKTDKLIWTVPLVIALMMKYSADIESDSFGDPVDVITHDKVLMGMAFIYAIIMLLLIYIPRL